ncbi:MAG TPA: YidC/Oxa1 family membrane protein insertase [Candidatus Saccharimonadales bacterium]|nr:YidC/Oxa1 family membrane protein insertase [Candidatus Saccharimonadales bacterium]
MSSPSFFNIILVWPFLNVLVAIYKLLIIVHIPYALGFSIILLTALIRLILSPLTNSQMRASKKMQDLAPHISRLKEKHKGDSKRIQVETMKLYKEHNVNPAAGCLPMIIQLPLIWGLYSVLSQIVRANSASALTEINKVMYTSALHLTKAWDPSFFGVPLGKSPSQLFSSMGVLVFLVPLLTGLFQLLQSKMLISKPHPGVKLAKDKTGKEVALGQKKSDDFASAFQTQSLYIFPVMIGFFSYTFPIGLSLYWNTFTIFGIIQQYKITGLGGLHEWREKLRGRKDSTVLRKELQ